MCIPTWLFGPPPKIPDEIEMTRIAAYDGEQGRNRARNELHRGLPSDQVDTVALSAFDRIGALRATYPTRDGARETARIWQKVFAQYPQLVESLAILGRLYAMSERSFDDLGVERIDPLDPLRLARDQGRRDLALEILAHNLSMTELNHLMEASDEL